MLKEALEFFAEQAREADTPTRLDIADPRANWYLRGGDIVGVPTPKAPRDHVVRSLEDFVSLANRFGEPSTAWYSESCVVLMIDDADHRVERATLPLVHSDVFKTIRDLRASKSWMDQKAFVRLLRLDLASALSPVSLLNIVKNVRFDSGVAVTGKLNRTQESLGREIGSSVSTEQDIPEGVTLTCRVYSTPGAQVDVRIRADVDVDPSNGTFRLIPVPDEIESVLQYAMSTIGSKLTESLGEANAYYGSP